MSSTNFVLHVSANKLFVLQKRAVRIICGVSCRMHCRPLFKKLKILTLTSMFILDCLIYVKKNIDKYTICSTIHNYLTRNRSNIYVHKCNYKKTQNCFEPISLNLYNSLPNNIRNLLMITFKRIVG